MLYCTVCGKTYQPQHRWGGFADDYSCPHCGAEDEYKWMCVDCGNTFDEEVLVGDLCLHCLRERVTIATGREFLMATGYMADFVFNVMLGEGDLDTGRDKCSADRSKVNEWADSIFAKGATLDALCNDARTLDEMRSYILDNDDSFAYSFSVWLTDRANWTAPAYGGPYG